MNDNETIKALECCCLGGMSCPNGCPLYDYEGNCWYQLKRPLLDIINRQKAEIERLQDKLDTARREMLETIPLIGEDIKTAKGYFSFDEHRIAYWLHKKSIKCEG